MKNRIMIFAFAGMLSIAGVVYGVNSSKNTCPLEGTPECPKIDCPLAGTPDCPYEYIDKPSCCKKTEK